MFVHNKMSLVRLDFQKHDGTSTLDIEDIDMFFNLIKVGTSCDLLVSTGMTLLRINGGSGRSVMHAITYIVGRLGEDPHPFEGHLPIPFTM